MRGSFSLIFFQLSVMGFAIFFAASMTHWTLFILPTVFRIEFQIAEESLMFFMMISYLCYFWGVTIGCVLWKKIDENISCRTSVCLSLIAIAGANALLGYSKSFATLCLFKFFSGVFANVTKLGKSAIHELILKKYRKTAFYVEIGSHTFGTLCGPILGYLILAKTGSFRPTCLVISVLILTISIWNFVAFGLKYPQEEQIDEQELILPLRFRTSVDPEVNESSLLIQFNFHIYQNPTTWNMIVMLMINSAVFHSEFVLTSLFYIFRVKSESTFTFFSLPIINFTASLTNIIVLFLTAKFVPSIISYKKYIQWNIIIGFIFDMLTPLLTVYITSIGIEIGNEIALFFFYTIKFFLCYYLYSNLLSYFIMKSVLSEARPLLNIFLNFSKSCLGAFMFVLIAPLWKLSMEWSTLTQFEPYNETIVFGFLGTIKLLSLLYLQKFRFPSPGQSMAF